MTLATWTHSWMPTSPVPLRLDVRQVIAIWTHSCPSSPPPPLWLDVRQVIMKTAPSLLLSNLGKSPTVGRLLRFCPNVPRTYELPCCPGSGGHLLELRRTRCRRFAWSG